jgi:hypothetical protein
MPRKLRKNKIKSQERRQLQSSPEQVVKRDFEFSLNTFPQSPNKTITIKQIDNSHSLDQVKQVRHDIIKTVILAVCVFSLELVIYFAWLKG